MIIRARRHNCLSKTKLVEVTTMCCLACFMLMPVASAWPFFTGGAGAMGFKVVMALSNRETERLKDSQQQVSFEANKTLKEALVGRGTFTLQREDMTAVFEEGAQGKRIINLFSETLPKAQLKQMCEKLVTDVLRQYTYHQSMKLLKDKGFVVAHENILDDSTIQTTVRRWLPTLYDSNASKNAQKEEITFEIAPDGILRVVLSGVEEEKRQLYLEEFCATIGKLIENSIPEHHHPPGHAHIHRHTHGAVTAH